MAWEKKKKKRTLIWPYGIFPCNSKCKKMKICTRSEFNAQGMLRAGACTCQVLSKKASNLWFKLRHRCRGTSESDQIYGRQLEAPFIPVILLTAIWYIANALRAFLQVWSGKKRTDFVGQRSHRRHKTMFSRKKQKWSDHQAELIKWSFRVWWIHFFAEYPNWN